MYVVLKPYVTFIMIFNAFSLDCLCNVAQSYSFSGRYTAFLSPVEIIKMKVYTPYGVLNKQIYDLDGPTNIQRSEKTSTRHSGDLGNSLGKLGQS